MSDCRILILQTLVQFSIRLFLEIIRVLFIGNLDQLFGINEVVCEASDHPLALLLLDRLLGRVVLQILL